MTFDTLDSGLWTVHTSGGASVEIENGRLKCSIPAHADPNAWAYIESRFVLAGAFSAQVDYELTEALVGTTAAAGIQAVPENLMKCVRDQTWEYSAGWHQYETITASFHGNYSYHKFPGGNQAGSLLLTRNAGTGGWGQYNLGSGWITVYSYSPNHGDGPVQLGVWGWPAGAGTTVYFDNFVVDNVNVPEPATLALLALGGVVVMARGRTLLASKA
ncbi:MAG: PEP-CTERM sorting domain-containing protein [Armatimonadota bacterium]